MLQIFVLYLSVLKRDLYFTFMRTVVELINKCSVIGERFKYYVDEVKGYFDNLNQVYLKYDPEFYSEQLSQANKERIYAFRRMREMIRYQSIYGETDEKKLVAGRLLKITDLYGGSEIPNQKMSAMTASIANIIEDFEDKHEADLELLGISDLVEALKLAQQEFDRIYMLRVEHDAENGKNAMEEARKKMDEAYRDLVAIINLEAKRDAEGELTDFIKQLNVVISENRTYTGQGQVGSTGSGSSSDSPVFKTATFDMVNGDQIKRKVEVGTVLIAPDNTYGYIWNKEVPEFMPNKNVTFREIPITSEEAIAMFHFFDHREEEIRQLVGSVLNAPANSPGYYWDPTVPATMPAENTNYYEMPIVGEGGSGEGSGSGSGEGSGSGSGSGTGSGGTGTGGTGGGSGEPRMVRADFFYLDGTEYNMTGKPGTRLIAPEPDPGNYWEPTPPMYFPDHDTEYHEVEGSGEGDGDDDAGFGR